MNPIFDKETRELLAITLNEAGIDMSEAIRIVRKKYEAALREAVLSLLGDMYSHFYNNELHKVLKYLDNEGDYYYIDLTSICGLQNMKDVIDTLDNLSNPKLTTL